LAYQVLMSPKAAKCQDCGDVIQAFGPRVDWTTDDINWNKGTIKRRYCLECGIKRMKLEVKETNQVLTAATNVWNLRAKTYGWKKKPKHKAKSPKTDICPTCKKPAMVLARKRGSGQLLLCEQGHYMLI